MGLIDIIDPKGLLVLPIIVILGIIIFGSLKKTTSNPVSKAIAERGQLSLILLMIGVPSGLLTILLYLAGRH